MTGTEFQQARQRAGLSYRRAADRLGVSVGAVQHWERSERVPEQAERIRDLVMTASELEAVMETIGRLTTVCERVLGKPVAPGLRQQLTTQPLVGIGALMRLVMTPAQADRRAKHDERITELMTLIPTDLPRQVPLAAQGAYELGYYHERGGA